MHRNKLLKILSKYDPKCIEESLAKKQILDFITSHTNCFERSLQIGHMTASCWLLNEAETKALLMHHKKLNMWLQLGGHADGETDLLKVAIKEAQEESGLDDVVPVMEDIFDIDVHKIPGNSKEPEHLHYDIRFLLKTRKENSIQANAESNGLLWIDIDAKDFPTRERTILRMIEKWKSRKKSEERAFF